MSGNIFGWFGMDGLMAELMIDWLDQKVSRYDNTDTIRYSF